MNDKHNNAHGRVPSASVSPFDQIFGKRIKGAGMSDPSGVAPRTLVHERESSLPQTLVPNLRAARPAMQAAAGDDDLMSQAPAAAPRKTIPSVA